MPNDANQANVDTVDAVEFAIQNGYPPVRLSPSGLWRGLRTACYRHDYPEAAQPPHRQTVVTLNLSGPAPIERHRGGKMEHATWLYSTIAVHPPGDPARWVYHAPVDVLHLNLEPVFLTGTAHSLGRDHASFEVLDRINQSDAVIQHLGLLLHREMEDDCPGGRLYGESLATALSVHLFTRHSAFPSKLRDYARGLGASDLSRVLAYIGDCLADDLSLDDLAASVHLSPYHFARLFKQSTGLAPHQYVIARRVERAKSLLLSGRLTVGEVAQAVGFYDHAHFIRHFKKATGQTPRAYREGR